MAKRWQQEVERQEQQRCQIERQCQQEAERQQQQRRQHERQCQEEMQRQMQRQRQAKDAAESLKPIPKDPWLSAQPTSGSGSSASLTSGQAITGTASTEGLTATPQQQQGENLPPYKYSTGRSDLGQQNIQPGLSLMQVGSRDARGDDNLSFFSESQINPGIIEPPKMMPKNVESSLSGQSRPKSDAGAMKQSQEIRPAERRMQYTEDVGLKVFGKPAKTKSGSERYINVLNSLHCDWIVPM